MVQIHARFSACRNARWWAAALVLFTLAGARVHAQNALVVEADRVATASDLASGGKLQLGDLTVGSATCIAADNDRPFADLDCDGTKEAGEEYLDGASGGSGSDPLSSIYHPDRPPATCAACDEWDGGSDDLTWRNSNFGSSTVSYERDAQCIVSDGTNAMQVRWTDPPAGDFTFSTRVRLTGRDSQDLYAAGLLVLAAGTESAPTRMHTMRVHSMSSSDDHVRLAAERWPQYTAWTSFDATRIVDRELVGCTTCLQGRWDDAAGSLRWFAAEDCQSWRHIATIDSIDVLSIGMSVRHDSGTPEDRLCFDWFRVRTDGNGLAGETGE